MSLTARQLSDAGVELPEIPDRLFFSIREVSDMCAVEPHVLRYWETEFDHIKPVKKGGNRRFYRQSDVYAVLQIKHLLYDQSFTIRGAKKRLMSGELKHEVVQQHRQSSLRDIRKELEFVRDLLS
ncbi:MAG: MerR family transcriptional regulator [Mariprofundaceae bacterium]|nr:MerR family transcriptional regulator [Mariprofundaceae bacterium]